MPTITKHIVAIACTPERRDALVDFLNVTVAGASDFVSMSAPLQAVGTPGVIAGYVTRAKMTPAQYAIWESRPPVTGVRALETHRVISYADVLTPERLRLLPWIARNDPSVLQEIPSRLRKILRILWRLRKDGSRRITADDLTLVRRRRGQDGEPITALDLLDDLGFEPYAGDV